MRRVIGGDGVDGAVGERLTQSGDVFVGAQRRVDLAGGVVAEHGRVGEQQVVRRHLGR